MPMPIIVFSMTAAIVGSICNLQYERQSCKTSHFIDRRCHRL